MANGPLGVAGTSLPGTPEPGDEPDAAPLGTSASPLFARTPEPLPAVPPTPVPVLQLTLLYGAILLFAGGYFWYTARLATEDAHNAA